MFVRSLLAAAVVALFGATVPALPSYAADPVKDLYVAADGSDTNDCSQASPCATVNQAVFDADATGTTIHVGAGTFDGPVRPGVFGRSVTIQGVSPADTTLTASEGTMAWDGTVVELYGTTETTMSNLTVSGTVAGAVSVIDADASVHLDHVAVTGGGCGL